MREKYESLPLATLRDLAKAMEKTETVRQMKAIVPEFKSQNSEYSKLDN